jgi:hypothetical protein
MAGTWSKTMKKETAILRMNFIEKSNGNQNAALRRTASAYGKFTGNKIEIL